MSSNEGLRKVALRASAYEFLGFGASQALRLLSNLVLTRLLFPEAFGLSTMVAVFSQGLVMLSDVGLGASIVQSPQGDDEDFLNTAWTISVIRGATLYAIAAACAWPMSVLYGEPLLCPLLIVGSAGVLITGFASTSLLTLRRRVDSRVLTIVDLIGQVVSLLAIVGTAYWTRSVWALIVGTYVSATFRTIVSHYFLDVGYRNRFQWSKEAAQALTNFGRWIFLSSALQFVAQQADRLYLGRAAGMAELGLYTVAATLSELGGMIVSRLTQQVLYPIFSRVFRERPADLRSSYYKARLALDAVVLPLAGAGAVLAPVVIDVLYDDRYAEAGWMLRVLMFRVVVAAVLTPCETALFSSGQSRSGFSRSALRMTVMVVGLPVASHFWGLRGIIWVTTLADVPGLILLLSYFRKQQLLNVKRELLVPVFFAAGALVAWPLGMAYDAAFR